jgi:hypothetical protein
MNKENEFNLNLSCNSNEKVPIISISNKSKSNSSNNQNSKKFPKKFPRKLKNYDNEQNSYSFSIRHKMKKNSGNKTENSFSMFTYTQNSIIQKNEKSKDSKEILEENKSLTEKKGKRINSGNETPQKKSDKKIILIETFRNKKKDVLNVDDIHGKNLMEYFEKMSEKIDKEEKNKNRVPSVGNKIKNSFKLKNPVVNTNKSWNKNKFGFLFTRVPLRINNKTKKINDNNSAIFPPKKNNRPASRYNTSNIKSLQNLLNQNNINIDLKNLIEKYRPNKISKKGTNTNSSTEKNNSAKKLRFQKIQKTPNSDTHQRKFSFSHLKMRETIMKNNLFQDYNKKHNEMINVNKLININERKPNDKMFEKNMIFHPQIKNKNSEIFAPLNKNNIMINTKKKKQSENKNNIQKINDYYLKYKEKMETGKNKKSGI